MVFRAKGSRTWKAKITARHQTATLSTGTDDRPLAEEIEAFAKRLVSRRRWEAVNAILSRRLKLAAAYDADLRGTLDELVASLDEVDLSPLVDEWNGRGRRSRENAKYVRQVRRFVPAGERFPLSRFRVREIGRFLRGLPVDEPTRNRYRAALSQFGWWLVEEEHLTSNPVASVRGFSENPPRSVFYTPAEARRVLDALPQPFRCLEAIMCATGMEWGATCPLRRRDIDLSAQTIRAHGTKTADRRRVCRITEPWCVALIEEYVGTLTPDAPLFAGITDKQALAAHHDAVRAVNLEPSTLHDWRHTYAVTALKRGDDPQDVKEQLGHAPNSVMLYRVYAVEIREGREARKTKAQATNPATTPENLREVHRAK